MNTGACKIDMVKIISVDCVLTVNVGLEAQPDLEEIRKRRGRGSVHKIVL